MDREPHNFQKSTTCNQHPLMGVLVTAVAGFFVNATNLHAQTPPPIEGLPPGAQFCQIVLTQAGSMNPSVDRRKLSSRIPGGKPGYANVTTTNGRYRIHVDLPVSFVSAPVQGNDDVKFAAGFRGNGATNFGPTKYTLSRKLRRGMTRITTNMHARKTVGAFPSGHYSAALTLRCE